VSDVANTPIMIGVTGKRDLAGDDNAVRKALRWCFALLDEAFPASRKLLLSGTAAGTDTIAAEEALDREGRTVAAVLPLELNLYIQDFDTGDEARLRNLLANPRVSRCDLEVLIDPSTGRGFTDQALTRKPDQANPSRADHYEQAGLYIAERSTLLIGVMYHDEMPDRIGGTARKVDFRLRSSPDRDARRIIQNGHRLRAYSALDNFERGPVWLIDMRSVADNTDDVLHAV
jgi:hypothetical protein